MDHHRTVLNTRLDRICRPLRQWPRLTCAMGYPPGTRVVWAATGTETVGTIRNDLPDATGRVVVEWDGIGTYRENPANLRPAPQSPPTPPVPL